jgi:lysophospholipase L1-like esterase
VKYLPWLCCVVALAASQLHADDRPAPFALKDGDRVVFVGNDFFDRDVQTGYIETALTLRYPKSNIIFRNLGYSGDTVWADARTLCSGWDLFGPEDQGFQRLKKLVTELKPTVILVSYGMNESFAGKAGLDHFTEGLNRMLDMLAATQARIVLVSPIAHENLGPPLPDPAAHNADLKLYVDALQKAANDRGDGFIDLFNLPKSDRPITSDGIHPTPNGYRFLAGAILKQTSGDAAPVDSQGSETLRSAIIKKNADFFHYWRPENDTYVFGYRNHEQGRNAPEVPKFLPLAEEDDKKIAELRKQTNAQSAEH